MEVGARGCKLAIAQTEATAAAVAFSKATALSNAYSSKKLPCELETSLGDLRMAPFPSRSDSVAAT